MTNPRRSQRGTRDRTGGRGGLFLLLLVTLVSVPGTIRGDDQRGGSFGAAATLIVVDSGVTPGMITVSPFLISYMTGRSGTGAGPQEVPGIVLATEDRRVRLIDPDGRVVTTVRTGERSPAAIFPVATGILRVLRAGGPDLLVGYSGGRVTVAHPRAGAIGTDGGGGNGIEGEPVAVYPDPEENAYLLYSSGAVAYRSTAGNVLWSRPLPAPVRSHGSDGSTVYVGLGDGRVFAFYPGGRGEMIARVEGAVEDVINVDDQGRSGQGRLAVLDSEGRLYLLAPHRDRGQWSIQWSTDLGERYRGTRGRFAEGGAGNEIAVYVERGPVSMVDRDGRVLWRREPGGEGVRSATILRPGGDGTGDSFLLVIDALARGHLYSRDGAVATVIHLDGVPDRVVPFDGINRVFLGYPDWRYDILALAGDAVGDATTSPPTRSAGASRSGGYAGPRNPSALRRYADAVLSGDSHRQRSDLLDTLRSRLAGGRLFAEVAVMREILEDLSLEAFSDPVLRGGIVQNDFPAVRREAVTLLGELGDRSSRGVLVRVVRSDPDVTVVSAALAATARTGRDDGSAVIYGFERFRTASERDRALLAEGIIACLESTVPDQGETVPAERRRIAISLAGANIPRALRERATRVVRDQ